MAGSSGAPRPTVAGLLREVWPMLRARRRDLVELEGHVVVGVAATLVIPLAGKYLLDEVLPRGELDRLAVFVGALAVAYLASGAADRRRTILAGRLDQAVATGLQARLFDHLLRLSHDFYARARLGDLMTRFTDDVATVTRAVAGVTSTAVGAALSTVAAAITLLVLSARLALAVLVVTPLFGLAYRHLQERFHHAGRDRQRREARTADLVEEHLAAHTVVKAFTREPAARRAMDAELAGLRASGRRLTLLGGLFRASRSLTITLAQVIVFGYGGYLAITGGLTPGTLLAFVALVPALFEPIVELTTMGQEVQTASGSLERITELLDEPVRVTDPADPSPAPRFASSIRFESVGFGYGGPAPVLQDVDLDIPAGQHVAVVGASGSGKSTLVALLLRFWDPEQGRILVDGADLRDLRLEDLRGAIGVVPQDTFVFGATVRDNIALGAPGATDEQVVAAARAAAFHHVVAALPDGYGTLLGERGVGLSGGQRQRLAIARALLRDPRLLVLDEATSSLDPATEAEVLGTLERVGRGRTVVTVTHRLPAAARADRIVVVSGGRVVEAGTHAELLAARGAYRRMVEAEAGAAPAPRIDVGRLRQIPLFAPLSPEAIDEIAARVTVETVPADHEVVRQGDPGERFYLIGRGTAQVLHDDGTGERVINVMHEGDHFGEIALLRDTTRTATVRTATECELLWLERGDFTRLVEQEAAGESLRAAAVERLGRTPGFGPELGSGCEPGSEPGAGRAS